MIILVCSWLRRAGNASQGVSIYFIELFGYLINILCENSSSLSLPKLLGYLVEISCQDHSLVAIPVQVIGLFGYLVKVSCENSFSGRLVQWKPNFSPLGESMVGSLVPIARQVRTSTYLSKELPTQDWIFSTPCLVGEVGGGPGQHNCRP